MSAQTITTTGSVALPPYNDVVDDWKIVAESAREMIFEARNLGGHQQEIVSIEVSKLEDDLQFHDGSLPIRRAEITVVTRLT